MRLKRILKRYWMPIALFIIGTLSMCLLCWSITSHTKQRQDFAMMNAIMDMQLNTATAHLWFEEALYGDPTVDLDNVWADFDRGIGLSASILSGGDSGHGLVLEPLQESSLRKQVEDFHALLRQFKAIAVQRYQDPSTAGIGSPLDQQFDGVFEQFMAKARVFEETIEDAQISAQLKDQRLLSVTSLVWAVILIAAIAALSTREVRRLAAEEKLLIANEKLGAQTEELNQHRMHLIELVAERTAELSATNRELQTEILEHKQTLGVLEASRNRFEKLSLEFNALLDAIPDQIILLSPELAIQWANRSAAGTAGVSPAGIGEYHCYQLRDDRYSPCEDCPVLTAFHTGEIGYRQYPARNGSVWEVKAFPIRDAKGEVKNVIEVSTDVTQKLSLQAESMRMARLASMGELAAGVAHEINNPINGIVNYAQILIDESGPGGDEIEIPKRIIKEGNRIATIVRSLLSFARQDKAERMPVHIHEILADSLALSGMQLEKDGITIKVDVPPELPQILANPQQIEQVLLNIINNARHALNERYPQSDPNKILEIQGEALTIMDRPYVRMAFHDRGKGIPEGHLNRLMDPFFSTKDETCSTGLGLSISHGIVSDHGGKLTIKSVEHQYTKVEVLLPVSGTAHAPELASAGTHD
jgi:two-component system NtrC family sensor kinase